MFRPSLPLPGSLGRRKPYEPEQPAGDAVEGYDANRRASGGNIRDSSNAVATHASAVKRHQHNRWKRFKARPCCGCVFWICNRSQTAPRRPRHPLGRQDDRLHATRFRRDHPQRKTGKFFNKIERSKCQTPEELRFEHSWYDCERCEPAEITDTRTSEGSGASPYWTSCGA